MECGICYDTVTEENFKVLECNHSICKCCFSKLRSYTCPFCRTPIPSYFDQLLPSFESDTEDNFLIINVYDDFTDDTPIIPRIRNERRRRRRPRPRNESNQQNSIPSILTSEEVRSITQQISNIIMPNENIIVYNDSISDRNQQRQRTKRNRWRNSRSHQGNFMINF